MIRIKVDEDKIKCRIAFKVKKKKATVQSSKRKKKMKELTFYNDNQKIYEKFKKWMGEKTQNS